MAKVIIAPGIEIDAGDFFPDTSSIGGVLSNLTSQTSDLDIIGQGEIVTNFGEFTLQSGGRTIRYLGDFVSNVVLNLLGSSSSVTGSVARIIIEEDGEIVARLNLGRLLDLDLGGLTNPDGLLDLDLGTIAGGVLGDLLGDNGVSVLGAVQEPVDDLFDAIQGMIDAEAVDPGGNDQPSDGDDVITGTAADDDIDGLGGDDVINGGAGQDSLHGGAGNDTIRGGADDDQLFGDSGNDRLIGGPGKDRLVGGQGDDRIYGRASADVLKGGSDDDFLFGGRGDDRLRGGRGDDVLDGQRGRDLLLGGAGSDTFLFRGRSDSRGKEVDTIADFHRRENDHLDLSGFELDFVGRHRFSGDENEVRFVFKGDDTIVKVDLDADGKADFKIRLDDHIRLHADDFIL